MITLLVSYNSSLKVLVFSLFFVKSINSAGLFGAEIGYWGQANSMKSFNRIMTGSMDQDVDNMDLDLVSLVLYISAVIFALPPVSGPILGKMGRRKILMIAGILFAVAFAFQGVAANVSYPASRGLMYTGRVILGIPVAFSVTNSPMFLTEIAPKGKNIMYMYMPTSVTIDTSMFVN